MPVIAGVLVLGALRRHALRTSDPLIDLRLFRNRVFSASSITLFLVVISVFGGMLLLPLYLQVVRGESAMDTGLLLAPQGFGAMLAMPIAGRLTDRTGVGRIVPVGLVLVGAVVPRADPARGRHVLLGVRRRPVRAWASAWARR